jgi:protein TonB
MPRKAVAMFESISGKHHAVPHRGIVPLLISSAVHVVVIGAMAAVPLVYFNAELPEVPDMLAFVAAPPPPPPPPRRPPPPAAPKAAMRPKPKPKPVPTNVARPVPVEPPAEMAPESTGTETVDSEAMAGGVDWGVPGGILGGVVGGMVPSAIVPPPPPVVARGPVRVGGAITAPALVSRVEPVYPRLAVSANVQGVVILEAVVDREGRVENVEVLRSIPLLDDAATAAVRQWRYSPLLLNGRPERFVLTVTVSFSLDT